MMQFRVIVSTIDGKVEFVHEGFERKEEAEACWADILKEDRISDSTEYDVLSARFEALCYSTWVPISTKMMFKEK